MGHVQPREAVLLIRSVHTGDKDLSYEAFPIAPVLRFGTFEKAADEMAVDVGESSRAHTVVAACIVLPVITLVFILLRLYSRIFIVRSLGWDDCKRNFYTSFTS